MFDERERSDFLFFFAKTQKWQSQISYIVVVLKQQTADEFVESR